MSAKRLAVHALAVLMCASGVSALWAQPRVADGVLTDEKGMSLYVWDNELTVPGKVACIGPCAITWPPLLAKEGAKPSGDYSLMTRDDGKLQWAYKGRALYRFANDKQAGDRKGDGFRGIWHLVKP